MTNAPPAAPDDASETKVPTTKSADLVDTTPAQGDPRLAIPWGQTVYTPLLDWSFESASPDCNGWPVVGSDAAIRAIPAKSGAYSCKVCSNGNGTDLGVTRSLGRVGKGHYTLSAYVRKRADRTAPSQAVATIAGAKGTLVTSSAVSIREEWDRVQTDIDLTEDTDDLTINIGSADAAAENCMFVDDVVFAQTQ